MFLQKQCTGKSKKTIQNSAWYLASAQRMLAYGDFVNDLPTASTMTFSSVVGSSSDGFQEAPPSVVCVFTNPIPWAWTKHSDSILMSGIGQK